MRLHNGTTQRHGGGKETAPFLLPVTGAAERAASSQRVGVRSRPDGLDGGGWADGGLHGAAGCQKGVDNLLITLLKKFNFPLAM